MYKNKEDEVKYRKKYYRKNREKKRRFSSFWYASHPKEAKEASRRYYLKNKTAILRRQKVKDATPKYRFYRLRSSSAQRGLLVGITFDEFQKIINSACSYCGDKDKRIGIDRVDNSLGYLKDNCVSCCKTCNFMKLSQTKEDFLDQVFKIYKNNV